MPIPKRLLQLELEYLLLQLELLDTNVATTLPCSPAEGRLVGTRILSLKELCFLSTPPKGEEKCSFFAFLVSSVESLLSGPRRKNHPPSSSSSVRDPSDAELNTKAKSSTSFDDDNNDCLLQAASFSIFSGSRKVMGCVISLQGSPEEK